MIGTLVSLLVTLIVIGIVAYIGWMILGLLRLPAPIKNVVMIVST